VIPFLIRRLFLLGLLASVLSPLVRAQTSAHGAAFEAAASDARRFELAPGFKLSTWAAEPMLANGVAFSFDNQGRCYIAESHRWAVSIFDITQHTNWLAQDMSLRTVADRSAFLLRQFSTNTALLTRDSELVRRVEDRAGTGRADHSEIIANGFNSEVDGTAAGVLALGTNIWFANIPNLWRIQLGNETPSTPDAGKAPANALPLAGGNTATKASRVAIGSGFGVHIGVSGHDLHGLLRGPDGRIYMSFGDRGVCLTNREGIVINLPDCGGVLRCETDGSNLEVFCHGLRNPQELAFDDLGNLWTVDNDTAGADPCRVLHLVQYGDYGWRTSYQHMDGFGPWVKEELWKGGQDGILPPAGTVSQGPSGLAYYPGTGFGTRFAGTFLHCDFPAGIVAFTVKPSGASYVVDRKEKFFWNCWATDVDFGPDGAVYTLDWVTGWGRPMKGRIHRITSATPDAAEAARSAEVKQLLGEGMAARNEAALLKLLGHDDRRVRLESQWELAERGIKSLPGLAETAHANGPFYQRLHALWAIGQLARQIPDRTEEWELPLLKLLHVVSGSDHRLAAEAALVLAEAGNAEEITPLVRSLQSDPNLGIRLRVGAVASTLNYGKVSRPLPRNVDQLAAAAKRLHQTWISTFLSQHFPREFKLDLDPVAHVGRILAGAPQDPFLDHAAREVFISGAGLNDFHNRALAQAATNELADIRRIALLSYRRLGEFGALGNRWPGFKGYPASGVALADQITNFLSDPDPRLVIAAGRAIHDVPIAAGFPALASFITKIDCPTNLMSRAIDAAFRLGTQQHAQMLAGFAKRRDVPDWGRALALDALADWGKPKPLDRVNGLWRPLVGATGGAGSNAVVTLPADLGRSVTHEEAMAFKRNVQPAKRAFLRVADEILDPSTPDENGIVVGGSPAPLPVQLAVVDTAVRLGTREASTPLFSRFTRTNAPVELRRAIVSALAELKAAQAPEAVKLALADPDAGIRAAAVPYLDRLEGGDSLGIIRSLIEDAAVRNGARPPLGTIRLAQAALKALKTQSGDESDAVARTALQRLQRNELPSELELDIITAADGRSDPQLRMAMADRFNAGQSPSSIARWKATRFGGDSARGRDLFFNHPAVQCSRCHQAWGAGGTVGPKLDGLGKRLKRDEILESIVTPNAKIAAGFETAVLTLKDGRTLTGRVKSEDASIVVLESTDGETGAPIELPIEVSKITERERGLSPMPEGLALMLTPFELRDLIEFLAGL